MTMKKIGMSSVLAATLLSTAVYAGTVAPINVTTDKIAIEKVMVEDTNVSVGAFVYTPKTIPAGTLANPVFQFIFSDSIVSSTATMNGYSVYEVNESNVSQSTEIANFVGLSDLNDKTKNVAIFRAIDSSYYASNNRSYYIGNNTDMNASTVAMDITVAQDCTPPAAGEGMLTVQAKLYSGDSQEPVDSSNVQTILESAREFTATVSQEFDARIDASDEFLTFKDGFVTGNNKKDSLQVQVTDASLAYQMEAASIKFVTTTSADLNDSITASAAFDSAATTDVFGDTNITSTLVALVDNNGTVNYDLNLTTNGTDKIKKGTFTTKVLLTKNGETIEVGANTCTGAGTELDSGEWTIYGYYAQIPNVRVTSNLETYMTFTNTSSIAAPVIFTILPDLVADATVNTDTSVNTGECIYTSATEIPANGSMKFTMSKVFEAARTSGGTNCANLPTNMTNAGVEVAIPTEPNNVYGNAYTKNVSANDFIVLPVYNTSEIAQ